MRLLCDAGNHRLRLGSCDTQRVVLGAQVSGHGIGMDIHEWPYLVGSDATPLDVGMCFSNEPMICIPGEFGIRGIPTLILFKNGVPAAQKVGALAKGQLTSFIESNI